MKMRASEEQKFITGLTKCLNFHLPHHGLTAALQHTETSSALWYAPRLLHTRPPWEHRGLQGLTTLMLIGEY